jgi:hypothetical protein
MRLFRKGTNEQVAGGDRVLATMGGRAYRISDWNPPHPREGVVGRVYCWAEHDPDHVGEAMIGIRGFNVEEIGLEWR